MTHKTLADYYAGVPRYTQSAQDAARHDALENWAREIAPSLYSDKSNDWSEELNDLADILGDDDYRAEAR